MFGNVMMPDESPFDGISPEGLARINEIVLNPSTHFAEEELEKLRATAATVVAAQTEAVEIIAEAATRESADAAGEQERRVAGWAFLMMLIHGEAEQAMQEAAHAAS